LVVLGMAAGLLIAQPANDASVRVEKIKYTDLAKLVGGHKSRIVVVDFWADFCLPCKREFPRLVELQAKYKNSGLVAISVALDDPTDASKRIAIQSFLAKQRADGLTNLQLDETPAFWQKKLGVDGPPCVFVFNRDGRIAGKWDDKVDYADI